MTFPIAWSDVVAVAPEAATAPAGRQVSILAAVAVEVDNDEETWGSRASIGAAYLAAHLNALSTRGGAGPLTASSEDRLSESYASMLQFGILATTIYGSEYLRQLRQLPTTLGMVF